MRVGLFTEVYHPYESGVVTAVEMLKKSLEKQGHKAFIITINADKNLKYKREGDIIRIPGIPSNINNFNIRITYPFAAVKMVRDLKLDIIHSHTEFGIGMFGRHMAKKLNIPFVQTYHTMYEDCVKYVTKGMFPILSNRITVKLTKAYYNDPYIREIIVPGKKPADLLKNKYKIKNNINIIPNGVNLNDFYKENIKDKDVEKLRKKYKLNKDDFVILWVGRLGYEKNIDLLISNHKKIVDKYPNTKLLIVGRGQHEAKLRQLTRKYNIEDSVIFTGIVHHDKVHKYFQLGTIFATASVFETQGITIIESLAGSVPVVCVKDDSFKDIVKNNYNGIFFKTPSEYVKAVISLIEDRKKLENLISNSRASSDEYSMENFGIKTLKVYESAIKKHEKSM